MNNMINYKKTQIGSIVIEAFEKTNKTSIYIYDTQKGLNLMKKIDIIKGVKKS